VSYETIRRWCFKFGPRYRIALKRREGRLGDDWYLDEAFVATNGERCYLWRAVDQDGDVIDILLQKRRTQQAAERFFRKALKGQGAEPRRLVTDKLRSYPPAVRAVILNAVHDTEQYASNRTELSHQPTRQRDRQMKRFKSRYQAQHFLGIHARVNKLFRYGRHHLRAMNHRLFRAREFATWKHVTCV